MSNVKILFHIGYIFGKNYFTSQFFFSHNVICIACCVGICQAFQKHFH